MAGSPVASPFPYDRKLWFFPDERSIMTDCCTRSLGSSLGGGRRQTLIWRAFSPAVPALSGPASESGRNDEALVWVGCPRTGPTLWPTPSCHNTACLPVGGGGLDRSLCLAQTSAALVLTNCCKTNGNSGLSGQPGLTTPTPRCLPMGKALRLRVMVQCMIPANGQTLDGVSTLSAA